MFISFRHSFQLVISGTPVSLDPPSWSLFGRDTPRSRRYCRDGGSSSLRILSLKCSSNSSLTWTLSDSYCLMACLQPSPYSSMATLVFSLEKGLQVCKCLTGWEQLIYSEILYGCGHGNRCQDEKILFRPIIFCAKIAGGVAQMEKRSLSIWEVPGSRPGGSSLFYSYIVLVLKAKEGWAFDYQSGSISLIVL